MHFGKIPNRKSVLLFFLIFVIIFTFGCTNYKYTQIINENGSSTLTLISDYSNMLTKNAKDDGLTFSKELDKFKSEQMSKCNDIKNKGFDCEIKDSKVIISEKLTPEEYYNFSMKSNIPNYNYEVKLYKLPNLELNELSNGNNLISFDEFDFGKNLTDQTKNLITFANENNVVLEYSITMPGEITYVNWENGVEINGNKAIFNLLEIEKNNKILIIKSERKNEFYSYAILLVFLLVLVYVFYLLFIKSKKIEKQNKKK